ncbi:hypothetical protein LDENG_00194080 [Lucifuga dentata]|nr:hypothetical protein LDENG_00194080 [Lucifuga dentata]
MVCAMEANSQAHFPARAGSVVLCFASGRQLHRVRGDTVEPISPGKPWTHCCDGHQATEGAHAVWILTSPNWNKRIKTH